jgi:hypothetical protein
MKILNDLSCNKLDINIQKTIFIGLPSNIPANTFNVNMNVFNYVYHAIIPIWRNIIENIHKE